MTTATPFDPAQRFVRIVEERADGFVAFEFAVGEPELFVEMLLGREQFDEFCARQGVQPSHGGLPPAAAGEAAHEWDWTLQQARQQHFRHEPDGTG
jgi:phenol/toluene 2-monooxygenase (NADH) P0/A0